MNIVDQILFQCRYHPAAPAMCTPGTGIGLVSYGRLEQYINNISRKVMTLNLSAKNIVAIYIEDQIFHASIVLALTRLGIITFSGRREKFPSEMHVDAIIADAPIPFLFGYRLIVADYSWLADNNSTVSTDQLGGNAASDTCRIILTSGTTGEAKAVALTHKMLSDRICRHHGVFGPSLAPCSRIFSDLSQSTSLGFQFLIYTLWRGGTFFMMGDRFDAAFQAFEYYKVQCWVASPSGLANLLQHYGDYPSYQSRLKLIISGGDLLSQTLSERIRARLCSNLVSAYGSTEASVIATAPAHAVGHIRGAVGYVTPGTEVQIINEREEILPRATEGFVRIKSEFGVQEYLGNPEESGKVFRDGWFYPGDVGVLTSDDVLVIAGRQNSVLNVGGDKLQPEAIEEVLATFPGIDEAAVFTLPNELGIEVVSAMIVTRSTIDEDRIKIHVGAHLPQVFVPKRVISVEEIPHNAMGKIDRSRLAEIAHAKLSVAARQG